MADQQRSRLPLIGVGVLVVIAVAVAAFLFFTRDTSDPELELSDDTLHGVAQPVTIDLTARSSGDTFTVQGSAPVQMAGYQMEAPSIGGYVEVEDNGSFEFIVNFQRG